MNKLGILISSPGNNQKFHSLSRELNLLKETRPDIDAIVFYYDYGPIIGETNFAMMEMKHAYNYDGIIIATDGYTAPVLDKCLRPKELYFYIWNLDWKYNVTTFKANQNIYLNPKLNLIARSRSHHKLITQVWKEPTHIISEFNHEQIERHFFSK